MVGRGNQAAYWIDREAVCERVHLGSGSTILVKTQTVAFSSYPPVFACGRKRNGTAAIGDIGPFNAWHQLCVDDVHVR